MRILEKFKCSKCGLEFGRSKFKTHLRRKLPCNVQSSINLIISEYERLIDKFEALDQDNLRPDEKIYFKNRINDLQLFHNNLSEDEKIISEDFYKENLKEFVDSFLKNEGLE